MIKVVRANICDISDTKNICSIANAFGPMVSSVAKEIKSKGGKEIEDESFYACNKVKYNVGDVYVTGSGKLPFEKIFHLVVTNYPNEKTNYETIDRCLSNLVPYCKMIGAKSISVPAMGIGAGGLQIDKVSQIYKRVLASEESVLFYIVDLDPVFIYQFMEYM
jgi:O-acetyl-ADP-ribose deacetylase (regulator of RNase III)